MGSDIGRARGFAALASLALIAVTLSPVLRRPTDDGFPLSTYPMFATKRLTTMTMTYALGVGAGGERIALSPSLLGTGEVLQAMRVIESAVAGGPPALMKLCKLIASRAAGDRDYRDVVTVRIVTGTHDAVEYLARGHIGKEVERVRCTP